MISISLLSLSPDILRRMVAKATAESAGTASECFVALVVITVGAAAAVAAALLGL